MGVVHSKTTGHKRGMLQAGVGRLASLLAAMPVGGQRLSKPQGTADAPKQSLKTGSWTGMQGGAGRWLDSALAL